MGSQMGKALHNRYTTSFEDAVEDMSIERKVALYKDLQQQASLLTDLQQQLIQSLKQMTDEEADLREREDFLKARRQAYLKKLDPSLAEREEEEDNNNEEDDDEDEKDQQENDPSIADVNNNNKRREDPNTDSPAKNVDSESKDEGKLGSIEVRDGPKDQKVESMRNFLEKDLPEIQRTVALRARTLWWKRREFDEKLEETQEKLKEVQGYITALEPGIPAVSANTV